MFKSILIHYCKLFVYIIFKKKYPYKKWEIYSKTKIHKKQSKKIVFVCDGFKNHGGLTDRFKGLLTTYSEAKRLNISFYIYWISPFNLNDLLVPSGKCNWIIDEQEILFDYEYSFPFIMDISPVNYKNIIKKYLFRYCLKDKRDIYVYSNLMHQKNNLSHLFNELFKPSDLLQNNIDFYIKEIGTSYYSYTFRFGNLLNDFNDIIGSPLPDEKKNEFINKNILELKRLLNQLPNGYKALVTSDSIKFLRELRNLDERIFFIEKDLCHLDFYVYEKEKRKIDANEIGLKSFIDFYLIMNAKKVFQVKTDKMYKSSFPVFAAEIGNKPYFLHTF